VIEKPAEPTPAAGDERERMVQKMFDEATGETLGHYGHFWYGLRRRAQETDEAYRQRCRRVAARRARRR